MRYRDWTCHCGHVFTAQVVMSEHTSNLSGEQTVFCPKCQKRPLIGTPQYEQVETQE